MGWFWQGVGRIIGRVFKILERFLEQPLGCLGFARIRYDSPTFTVVLRNPASFKRPRFPFYVLTGPLVPPGAFFGGPRGLSQILVAFPRAGQKPSSIKTMGKSNRNASGTHPHARNIPYKTALPVPCKLRFARQVRYFQGPA